MKTIRLGKTDLEVSRVGIGGIPIVRPTEEDAIAVVQRALDLGITLIDTANSYGPEVNERFIANTLYPYPEGLVVATKGGIVRPRIWTHWVLPLALNSFMVDARHH